MNITDQNIRNELNKLLHDLPTLERLAQIEEAKDGRWHDLVCLENKDADEDPRLRVSVRRRDLTSAIAINFVKPASSWIMNQRTIMEVVLVKPLPELVREWIGFLIGSITVAPTTFQPETTKQSEV